MQNVLILGGTGFIGSHIAEAIIENNDVHLSCLVRNESNTSFLKSKGIPFEKIDFGDIKLLTSFINRYDIIVNAVAVLNGSWHEREKREIEHLNKLFTAIISREKIFIHLGSIISYGYKLPFDPIDETFIPLSSFNDDLISQKKDAFIEKHIPVNQYYIIQPSSALGLRDKNGLTSTILESYKTGKFPLVSGGNSIISIIDARDIGNAFNFIINNHTNIPSGKYLIKGYDTSWDVLKSELDSVYDMSMKAMEIKKGLFKIIGWLGQYIFRSNKLNLKTASFLSDNKCYNSGKIENYGFKPRYSLQDTLLKITS
jgi:nucleoside-diphosphate-sugar epimerase